jgi:hypothetical protein
MYDAVYPGDEEVDQAQWRAFWTNHQKYHTICLGCIIKRRESTTGKLLKGPGGNKDDGRDGYRDKEDYPDYGPIYLSAASKAMMLNWYEKAKRNRKQKREKRDRRPVPDRGFREGGDRGERVLREISDDEGDGNVLPLSWASQSLMQVRLKESKFYSVLKKERIISHYFISLINDIEPETKPNLT